MADRNMVELCEALGANMKEARRRAGLTQAQLADEIGTVRQAVGRWERGACAPSLSMLCALADTLDTSADALLGRAVAQESRVPPISAPQDVVYRSRMEEALAIAGARKACA